MKKLALATGLLALVSAWIAGANDGFPGRAEYPNVKVMEVDELRQKLGQVVVVDVRSHYEWETLRIKDSVLHVVGTKTFADEIKQLRASTDKPIVFYCNGRTCYKSYHAVEEAAEAGVKDVYAYDAGIFEWTQAHPDQAVLLGETPADPKKLIASKVFKSKLLPPDQFADRAMDNESSLVIDVRDKYQRAGIGFFPGRERWAALDETDKLAQFFERAKKENRPIYIYDEVGRQVQWLQYSLEKAGVKEYYFMDKGAKGFVSILAKEDNVKMLKSE